MRIPYEIESEMLDILAGLLRGERTDFIVLSASEKQNVRATYEKLIRVITES